MRRIPPDILALSAGLMAGAAIEMRAWSGPASSGADYLAGVALLVGAFGAHRARPHERLAVLFAVAGATWFAGTLWEPLLYVHRGALAHVLLAYPGGRTRSRVGTATVVVAYAVSLSSATATDQLLTIAVGLLVVAAAGWRYAGATGAERRGRLAALAAAVLIEGTLVTITALRLHGSGASTVQLVVFDVVVALGSLGLAGDLVWGGWSRSAATGLVVDLGDSSEGVSLRDALGRALGDPSLIVGFRDGDAFFDDLGRRLALPAPGDGRTATPVDGDAVIVHDSGVDAEPALLAAAVAAARLAIANVDLQRDVAVRIAETEASSRRIVAAGDEQRRILEVELQGGALARLERILVDGDGLPQELATEVEEAIVSLRALARGLHPDWLRRGGLRLALAELAAHAPVRVEASVSVGPLPDSTELAAYFVCAEALTNVAKHAGATAAGVSVAERSGELLIVVTDDGHGGASIDGGAGLRGIADRVTALGGTLELLSPAGAGTRLAVTLPVSPPAATA
jgi:two-component sensor histidine kinase